jgi:phenylalanyl-tRNA synthetase alpha chain
MEKILESLSPTEKKVLPYIEEKNLVDICKKSNLDKVSVLRALEYLQNKGFLKLEVETKKIVDVGVNGALYRKKGLPERRLLNVLGEKRILGLKEAQKESKLSDEEFKASIGALKKKAFIELRNGKLFFSATKEEVSKRAWRKFFLMLCLLS